MGVNDPQGMTNLDPRGMVGRIYVGDHYTLQHTKYMNCGPHGFREEDFLRFPIISLWELMTPGHGQFRPQGLHWQDLCRKPLNIATYLSCGPHSFSEKDSFIIVFSTISPWKLMTP